MSGCVCSVPASPLQSVGPWSSDRTSQILSGPLIFHKKVLIMPSSPGILGEFQQDNLCDMPSTHILCSTNSSSHIVQSFSELLSYLKCSFPAPFLVFSTTSINANLSPLAILMSSCCSSHLWSQRIQVLSLKQHVQILPQPVSSHMGNWINNSRPPPSFPNFFISICLANMCWLAGFSYLNNWLWRIRKALNWEPRDQGLKALGSYPCPLPQPVFQSWSRRVLAFLTSILLPNPRTQTITWVTIFSNLPRMLHG